MSLSKEHTTAPEGNVRFEGIAALTVDDKARATVNTVKADKPIIWNMINIS